MGISQPQSRANVEGFSPVGDVKEVGAFFLKRREAIALVALVGLSATFAFAFDTLLPAFAVDVLNVGPRAFGVLVAALGVGSIIGALGSASLGRGAGAAAARAAGQVSGWSGASAGVTDCYRSELSNLPAAA
jgi:hypothetical protein